MLSVSLLLAAPTYQFADILGQRCYQKAGSLPLSPAPFPFLYGNMKITQAVLGLCLVTVLSPSGTGLTEKGDCYAYLQTRSQGHLVTAGKNSWKISRLWKCMCDSVAFSLLFSRSCSPPSGYAFYRIRPVAAPNSFTLHFLLLSLYQPIMQKMIYWLGRCVCFEHD